MDFQTATTKELYKGNNPFENQNLSFDIDKAIEQFMQNPANVTYGQAIKIVTGIANSYPNFEFRGRNALRGKTKDELQEIISAFIGEVQRRQISDQKESANTLNKEQKRLYNLQRWETDRHYYRDRYQDDIEELPQALGLPSGTDSVRKTKDALFALGLLDDVIYIPEKGKLYFHSRPNNQGTFPQQCSLKILKSILDQEIANDKLEATIYDSDEWKWIKFIFERIGLQMKLWKHNKLMNKKTHITEKSERQVGKLFANRFLNTFRNKPKDGIAQDNLTAMKMNKSKRIRKAMSNVGKAGMYNPFNKIGVKANENFQVFQKPGDLSAELLESEKAQAQQDAFKYASYIPTQSRQDLAQYQQRQAAQIQQVQVTQVPASITGPSIKRKFNMD